MGPLVRVIGEAESMVMINILVCPIMRRVFFLLLHQYMIQARTLMVVLAVDE